MATHLIPDVESLVDAILNARLQPRVETIEESASTGEYDVLVQFFAILHRATLNCIVDDLV